MSNPLSPFSLPPPSTIYLIIWLATTSHCTNAAQLLYPPVENLAPFKPTLIRPSGTTCGLELRDTLCSNLILDSKACQPQQQQQQPFINSTSSTTTLSPSPYLFFCDQSCPFGNVLANLSHLPQLPLEQMNPCVVVKDHVTALMRHDDSSIDNESSGRVWSYYFDPAGNSFCNGNGRVVAWRAFSLETSHQSPYIGFYNARTPAILKSGVTLTIWFRQAQSNNGYMNYLVAINYLKNY
jgi:hypothetical protein